MYKLKNRHKRKTLDKLRSMGMTFGPEYDVLADTLEASRKADADNAKITKIEYNPAPQKNDGKQYFIVKVTVSSEQFQNIVEVEIDGRLFQATRKDSVFERNAFYANVQVDFSTVVRLEENFELKVRLKDFLGLVLDTKTKTLMVKSGGVVIDKSVAEKEIKAKPTKSITIEQLIAFGVNKKRATEYIDALNQTFVDYEINTDLRIIHFLSQILHESGALRYTSEINAKDSDYRGCKGRGLIQLTYPENYKKYGNYESEDFLTSTADKEKLEKVPFSVRCAGWYWNIEKKLNKYADKNDFIQCTFKVNGGFNGNDDREKYFKNGCKILNKEFKYLEFKNSKIYNNYKACFAWGLWHDPAISSILFDKCANNNQKAIEGYKRFLELVPDNFTDTNWYKIKSQNEFSNLKYKKDGKFYVKIIDAAKQRLQKLTEK
jgi:predicted chitinase